MMLSSQNMILSKNKEDRIWFCKIIKKMDLILQKFEIYSKNKHKCIIWILIEKKKVSWRFMKKVLKIFLLLIHKTFCKRDNLLKKKYLKVIIAMFLLY